MGKMGVGLPAPDVSTEKTKVAVGICIMNHVDRNFFTHFVPFFCNIDRNYEAVLITVHRNYIHSSRQWRRQDES